MDEDKNLVQERGEIEAGAVTVTHELIARLQTATGPDRAIDGDIFALVGGEAWQRARIAAAEPCGAPFAVMDKGARERAPKYTASIDAALTLKPDGYFWALGTAELEHGKPSAGLWAPTPGRHRAIGFPISEDEGATPAIALCIAALRARLPG